MKLPELVAPAGDFEKLVTALHYGADAVYMGLSGLSLRAKADNFTEKALRDAAAYVRKIGKKLYITINIFPHNRDLSLIREHLAFLKKLAPDALIVSDPGVFGIVSDVLPAIPLHISTQANITNYSTAKFWEKAGAKRLVLSRELTIDEIKEIRDNVALELECFVHGAICISYSGRCYISSFLANRSANRGECTNSCRWNYALMEEKRPGVYRPVYENERGTYVMSSRDLCMIEHLDKLADAGVDSFKIEGRTKGINYVAGVVKIYREAVDALQKRPFGVNERWMRDLAMSSNRGFTTGMFLGRHPDEGYSHDDDKPYVMTHEFVGVVRKIENGKAEIALRNRINKGDTIEFLTPGLEGKTIQIDELLDADGNPIEGGKNSETVTIPVLEGVRVNDLIRRPLAGDN